MTNEAFARIKIDHLLKANGWHPTNGLGVRVEYPLEYGGRAGYATDWDETIVFAANKRRAETLAPTFNDVFADKKPSKTKGDGQRHVSHHGT